jgi:hypothetical protein
MHLSFFAKWAQANIKICKPGNTLESRVRFGVGLRFSVHRGLFAIPVAHNSVIILVVFYSCLVLFNNRGVFAALYPFAVFGFRALCFYRALHTSFCGVWH